MSDLARQIEQAVHTALGTQPQQKSYVPGVPEQSEGEKVIRFCLGKIALGEKEYTDNDIIAKAVAQGMTRTEAETCIANIREEWFMKSSAEKQKEKAMLDITQKLHKRVMYPNAEHDSDFDILKVGVAAGLTQAEVSEHIKVQKAAIEAKFSDRGGNLHTAHEDGLAAELAKL